MEMVAVLLVVQAAVRRGLVRTVAAQEHQDRVTLAVKTQPLVAFKAVVVVVAQAQ